MRANELLLAVNQKDPQSQNQRLREESVAWERWVEEALNIEKIANTPKHAITTPCKPILASRLLTTDIDDFAGEENWLPRLDAHRT